MIWYFTTKVKLKRKCSLWINHIESCNDGKLCSEASGISSRCRYRCRYQYQWWSAAVQRNMKLRAQQNEQYNYMMWLTIHLLNIGASFWCWWRLKMHRIHCNLICRFCCVVIHILNTWTTEKHWMHMNRETCVYTGTQSATNSHINFMLKRLVNWLLFHLNDMMRAECGASERMTRILGKFMWIYCAWWIHFASWCLFRHCVKLCDNWNKMQSTKHQPIVCVKYIKF